MGGVDRCDQVRNAYNVEGAMKTKFWYKKVFFGLFGMSVGNAFIIWRIGEGRGKGEHARFMQELFETLVRSKRASQAPPPVSRQHLPPPPSDEVRLQRNPPHFPESTPDRRQLRCSYCKRKARVQCDQCKQPLCSSIERDCFKLYHTVVVLPKIDSSKKDRRSVLPTKAPGRPRKK